MTEYRILQEVDSNGYEVPSVAVLNDDTQVIETWVRTVSCAVDYIDDVVGGILAIDVAGNGLEDDE